MSKKPNKYVEQLGLLRHDDYSALPETYYLAKKYSHGSRLIELVEVKNEVQSHIGTIDLYDVVLISRRCRLMDLNSQIFFEALNQIFSIDLRNKLYITSEVENIIGQKAYYQVNHPTYRTKRKNNDNY